jgi:hypothetical protein
LPQYSVAIIKIAIVRKSSVAKKKLENIFHHLHPTHSKQVRNITGSGFVIPPENRNPSNEYFQKKVKNNVDQFDGCCSATVSTTFIALHTNR